MSTLSTTEDIVANADYHSRLLTSIAELDYAATALKQHASYLSDLEGQLSVSEKRVGELAKATKRERKEHEQLRDSTARRMAAKLTGRLEKFQQRESKEEREYVEALQNEMVERDHMNMLKQLLAEAISVKEDLIQKAKKHERLRNELDSLYGRVFDGPSEPFQEEDRLEYDVHEAHRKHEQAQVALNVESQAAELLARAVGLMDECQRSVQEALSYSGFDIMGGGSMADLMERNALTNAQAYAAQVESLVNQAIRICPAVQPVGRVNISSGSLMSDVFFDNLYTDMAFHSKIKSCAAHVLLANNRLKAERDVAVLRAEGAGASLIVASQALENHRKELFALRKAIFESVVVSVPKPPSYEAVIVPSLPNATSPPGGPSSPQIASDGVTITTSGNGKAGTQGGLSPSPPTSQTSQTSSRLWGSKNPYAAAMAERTRSMSNSP